MYFGYFPEHWMNYLTNRNYYPSDKPRGVVTTSNMILQTSESLQVILQASEKQHETMKDTQCRHTVDGVIEFISGNQGEKKKYGF